MPNKMPVALTEREARQLLLVVEELPGLTGIRNRAIINLLLWGGLRLNEALSLEGRDVLFDQDLVEVRHGKGGGQATVPLPHEATLTLLEWAEHRPHCGGPFFVTSSRRKVLQQSMRSLLKRLAKRAGIERRLSPHVLRHTCATLLLERGATIKEVQAHLRHARIATTEIYLHLRPDAPERTRSKLGFAVSSGVDK